MSNTPLKAHATIVSMVKSLNKPLPLAINKTMVHPSLTYSLCGVGGREHSLHPLPNLSSKELVGDLQMRTKAIILDHRLVLLTTLKTSNFYGILDELGENEKMEYIPILAIIG
jgi:hypothetical protein